MAIPEPTADKALQRARFRAVRELFDRLNSDGFALDTLSMGMSARLGVRRGRRLHPGARGHRDLRGKNKNRKACAAMKIAFLGGGNMADALIGGLLAKGYAADSISVIELFPRRVTTWPRATKST